MLATKTKKLFKIPFQTFYLNKYGIPLDRTKINGKICNMIKQIKTILEKEKLKIKQYDLELKKYNHIGHLIVRRRKQKIFLCEVKSGVEKGITKNKAQIYKVARKEFLESYIEKAKYNCFILEQALSKFRDTTLPTKLQITELSHCIYTQEQLNWIMEQFEQNPFKQDQCKYITASGVKVRSKSERTIADKLTAHNILFRYECKLQLGKHTIYPDFIILKPDGTIIIWEHFGLMDNSQYELSTIKKVQIYNKCGYKQHTNLICTFEEDLEDPEVIENIIKRFIL